jgi:hypothetical protein
VHSKTDADFIISRFDTGLYHYLTANENDTVLEKYQPLLDEWGEKVIYIGKSDTAVFYERLRKFFSEPALMQLYADEQRIFADISDIQTELSEGMSTLLQRFSDLKQPKIYLHVSGLNQNVIVTDSLLSLSADKYLGADYPLYQQFFYDYQRQLMSPDRVTPDFLLGFLMANFPFQGKTGVLLDQMLYAGKLRYFIAQALPKRQLREVIGYTQEQEEWCIAQESRIWQSIMGNQHLLRPDERTTMKYLVEAPYTATLPSDSPGRVGIWLGQRIVKSYMQHHPKTTWAALMSLDPNQLLKDAQYRP